MSKVDIDLEYSVLPSSEDKIHTLEISDKKKKKKFSCCKVVLCILLCFIVLVLIALTALGVGCSYLYGQFIDRFTVPTPRSLPMVDTMDNFACTTEMVRVKGFFDMIIAGEEPPEDLSLTNVTINECFISHSDYLRDNAYVTLKEDYILVNTSLPISDRYFNAWGMLNLTLPSSENDVPDFATRFSFILDTYHSPRDLIADIDVYKDNNSGIVAAAIAYGKFLNWYVPADYIEAKENILDGLYEDEEIFALMKGIKKLSIKEGVITVHAHRHSAGVNSDVQHKEVKKQNNNNDETEFDLGVRSRKLLRKLLF